MAKEKKKKGQEIVAQEAAPRQNVEAVPPRMRDKYRQQVVPNMMKSFGYKNVMQVPRLTKISINRGVGDATGDAKLLTNAFEELQLISGQRPAITRSKHAISNFKLR